MAYVGFRPDSVEWSAPFHYVALVLGGRLEHTKYRRAKEILLSDGNMVRLAIHIDLATQALLLSSLFVDYRGQGIGTKTLNALKAYADTQNYRLRVVGVENPAFFRKFPYLQADDAVGTSFSSVTPQPSCG